MTMLQDPAPPNLTRFEQAIFNFLARGGEWRTSRDIGEATIIGWPTSAIKTHICHLRRKLAGSDWVIETRIGWGYRMGRRKVS